MVINRSFLLEKLDLLQKEISSLASICHKHGAKLKTIIEVGELKTDENIALASKIALSLVVILLKLPQVRRIQMLRRLKLRGYGKLFKRITTQPPEKSQNFKPAGGIRTPEDAKAYLDLMIQAFGHEQIGAHNFSNWRELSLLDTLNNFEKNQLLLLKHIPRGKILVEKFLFNQGEINEQTLTKNVFSFITIFMPWL